MQMPMRIASLAVLLAYTAATALAAEPNWSMVDAALGMHGSMQPGDVYKFGFARSDLDVHLDGVALEPAFALGSWLAFKQDGGHAIVMGDLVLLEDEVAPVMKRLTDAGIEITALHNHLLRARPFPMYMHVMGSGDAVEMARTLRAALEASKTPLSGSAAAPGSRAGRSAGRSDALDGAALERILGRKGTAKGDVYAFGIPRAETITMGKMSVPPAMGAAIGINFEPAGDGKAATTGDFVLRPDEVNPVLRALEQNGLEVMALHTHMLSEEPRLFFMHFWGHDDAEKLARGLKAALDHVDTK